ncbi:MAG TPA: hypothetical protein DCR14_07210 [Acidimicrobiaceae bacterium]|nr:hypothetical protein [Acidimicrobiaceae bacterium]
MNQRVDTVDQVDVGDVQRLARAALAAGDAVAAVELLQGAVEGGQTRLTVVHDLVRALHQAGRVDEAVVLLQRLVLAAPQRADLHLQLVRMLHRADRAAEALVAARHGCAAHPAHHDLWLARESMARTTGRWVDAREAGERLIELLPDDPDVWRRLAIAARHVDDDELMGRALDGWLAAAPENPSARHLHAAHRGERLERADAHYVTALFDSYADRFEEHLAELGYKAPELLVRRVAALLSAPVQAAADLGCGTGLVGAALVSGGLRPSVDSLVGVDLSPGMVSKARKRDCYDELVVGELTAFLDGRPGAFELLISADTLIYIGDLRPVFVAAARSLRAGGVLAFTIETPEPDGAGCDSAGYALTRSGRYVHHPSWIQRQLAACGFVEVQVEPCVLRFEERREVHGVVVTAFINRPI